MIRQILAWLCRILLAEFPISLRRSFKQAQLPDEISKRGCGAALP
jgi:hypothetical protein